MKRDWDLVREILFKLEGLGNTTSHLQPEQVKGFDPELVSYHMKIMGEARLIKVTCTDPLSDPIRCFAFSMTWEGHEFLDKIRADTVWNKVKVIVREKGLELSIEAIKRAGSIIIDSVLRSDGGAV